MDLLILPAIDGEVTAVVVEIKNSGDWDAFPADRVRPNLRAFASCRTTLTTMSITSARSRARSTTRLTVAMSRSCGTR